MRPARVVEPMERLTKRVRFTAQEAREVVREAREARCAGSSVESYGAGVVESGVHDLVKESAMGWAALIQLLLQILPIILKLFEKPTTLTDKQKVKLGQVRSLCQQFDSKCESQGVAAVAAPVAATEDW
jgi:hypothetical protein